MFTGKTLMITGGTGSFGTTVLDRFLKSDIQKIVIFSRDEKKQEDMRVALRSDKLAFHIGDTRDAASIMRAMQGVNYVFHAAALKQVPTCEFHPMEAVRTNVLGTENVIDAAVANGVERMVLLSTDKAVYPINAMGISKAMAEKVLIARSRQITSNTVLMATRYGNVMASRGSVIPLFIERVRAGESLGITDPNMTRFLMSLEDSVDLVLHAFAHGQQGDLFVQKAPASTIGDLALAICELFEVPVRQKIVGTRHGEKLFESLLSREEMVKATDMGRYWRVPADNRDQNYELFISEGEPRANVVEDYTSHNTQRLSVEEVKSLLLTLPYVRRELDSHIRSR
ncbi:polysaccharide biosynthesis protein [Sphingomonas lycopersici]|uniref:UDP-glucose 4-epimerase n=1 Tax=Sphingomonas lycopersici TaxID=2951807 RepID=A0AA41ZDS5_9SPHN|nr:polysaccharide biosynthesis protein [Sphingomonas lycopersici]MCW6537271.1 polysaccharide biosynthesis protein [Sphingomonas lycopersici]